MLFVSIQRKVGDLFFPETLLYWISGSHVGEYESYAYGLLVYDAVYVDRRYCSFGGILAAGFFTGFLFGTEN
jgi:hypothetical protein